MSREDIYQTNTTLPAPYLQPHIQQNLANAQGLVQDGFNNPQSYDGPRVAGFTADQNAAHDMASTGTGAWTEGMAGATDAVNQGLGQFSPENLAAMNQMNQSGTEYNIGQEYLNPYQQNVIDTTMSEMRRQQNMDMNQVSAQAAKAGAFGGSRHGVYEAETMRGHDANRTNALAQLNANNFAQAQNAQEAHRQRQLVGSQNMTNTANTAANSQYAGAQTQGGIEGLSQNMWMNDISTLGAVGDQQQQQDQRVNDVAYQDWNKDQMKPFELTAFYNDIISGVPSSQISSLSGTTAANGGNDLAQGLGGLGLVAAAGNDFGWWGD
jgi:hypothetical protein